MIKWLVNILLLLEIKCFDAHESDGDISVLLEEALGSAERTFSHTLVKNEN